MSRQDGLMGDNPLQGTIAPDDVSGPPSRARSPAALEEGRVNEPPTARGSVQTTGISGSSDGQSIWKQSAHPVALFFLFFFRCAAIATYLLCGFFSSSYVFSTVIVVVLLSLDFWTVRNVSGRVLVGLRFWNQVDDDGSSYWVFEHRNPNQPANAVDSKMFWIALYAFPAAWIVLLVVGILKFNISFIPIVILALVFNMTNTVGYTYADSDAKKRWASGIAASGMLGQMGGLSGKIVGGLIQGGVGKMFG